MKQLFEQIEQFGAKDPVVFGWLNMRRKGKLSDEQALFQLVKALITSKNLAIRVLDKHKQDQKVIQLRK
jgi:hypothetical protein